ncbi:MAG: class I SAM-dependent methyltransferase [bacterium]
MTDEELVRTGYDRIAQRYADDRYRFANWKELQEFSSELPKSARLLDVGCGAGVPVTKYLCNLGHEFVGIDISESMLTLARQNVPQATFVNMNMTAIDFPDESFDGLTSFYSVFHVNRLLHRDLFATFRRVLKPGGIMLVSVGYDAWEATEEFYGTLMYWSNYDSEESLGLIKQAGFDILFDRLVTTNNETHCWVLARAAKD